MAIIIIGIMNIIQTKTSLFSFWWKAWLALLLLAFGVPSLVARLVLLPSDQTRIDLLSGTKLPLADVSSFYLSRRKAAAWFPENALFNDLSMATFNLSEVAKGDMAKALSEESALWEYKALNVSPADAYGWYRMAYLYYMADGASKRVRKAWSLSMASAPYEPRLIFPRLEMAIGLGPVFLETDIAKIYVPHLVRDAWAQDPDMLAKMARDGNYVSIIENVLRNDPEDLASFRDKVGPAVVDKDNRVKPAASARDAK